MALTQLDPDNVSRMTFHYLVGDASGVRHFTEDHALRNSTVEEMTAALEAAGFSVSYDPDGLIGRGLYIGTKAA